MKFTLAEIRKSALRNPSTFEGEVDVSELETMNNDIRKIAPVHVFGDYSIHGDQIIFSFVIEGNMVLPCARTLVDVLYPFKINAREVFTTSPYINEDEEEEEIHPVSGEVLDLTPYIKENILLEIPFRVFSEDANQQAVPQKGNGWEVVSEETTEKKFDPRLRKLESLLNKDKEEK